MFIAEYESDRSTVRVTSPSGVIGMNSEEQREWVRRELETGNPTIHRVLELVAQIYLMDKSSFVE